MKKISIQFLRAYNGNEAVSIVQEYKNKIHMILTDVVMPEMSGKTLSEKFKR